VPAQAPGPTLTRATFRYPLSRVIAWELAASLGVAAIGGWVTGMHGAVSGLLGGVVNIVAAAAYAALVRASNPHTPTATVRTMIRAEAGKIALIVLQLWLVLTTYAAVVHLAFFSAFVVTVLVGQMASLLLRD
jgi:ATP synthase protein I